MDDIEELLKKYLPAAPHAELREQVVTSAGRNKGGSFVRGWLLVAATVMSAVLFYALAAHERQVIDRRLPSVIERPSASEELRP
jgi:hypothetical protein